LGPPSVVKSGQRRPAIVVTNDTAISHLNRVQVIPLTTNVSRVYPAEALVEVNDVLHKAMADQLTTG
jgi:mRNA interferase MazF